MSEETVDLILYLRDVVANVMCRLWKNEKVYCKTPKEQCPLYNVCPTVSEETKDAEIKLRLRA